MADVVQQPRAGHGVEISEKPIGVKEIRDHDYNKPFPVSTDREDAGSLGEDLDKEFKKERVIKENGVYFQIEFKPTEPK